MNIKEQFGQTEKLYHFTTFEKALKIIESNRLRFGRLSNMNDIHEADKLMFVDANNQLIEEFPSEVLDTLHDEIYKYRQISLTADDREDDKDGFDLHQMWGLYAENGEGVCLVFDRKDVDKVCDRTNIIHERVKYDEDIESFIISNAQESKEVLAEVSGRIPEIYFYKRKEWEHEQEYRLIKRCPNTVKEEYLLLDHALKFIILTSKLLDVDEVRYSSNIKEMKAKAHGIPILIYGNGLLDYSLIAHDGDDEIWNSNNGYDVLVLGENCKLAL